MVLKVLLVPHFVQRDDMQPCYPFMALNSKRSTIVLERKVLSNRPSSIADEEMRRFDRVVLDEVVHEVVEGSLRTCR